MYNKEIVAVASDEIAMIYKASLCICLFLFMSFILHYTINFISGQESDELALQILTKLT